MDEKTIAAAKADIEATGDLLERALKLSGMVVSLSFGSEEPSRRSHGVGKADQRLRAAFNGKRVPLFA